MKDVPFYKCSADDVYRKTSSQKEAYLTQIEGIKMIIQPHVYPSEKFRTTCFVLKSLESEFAGKTICDMGCGPGIVGLYAFLKGANKIIQADINPYAVQNAKENIKINEFERNRFDVIASDCFDAVPNQIFDVIVWNIPFHSDDIQITNPLMRAYYDPCFSSLSKFLTQIKNYSNQHTQIFISFSTKGDIAGLEKIFCDFGYEWKLWKVTNADQEYDNRIYRITFNL